MAPGKIPGSDYATLVDDVRDLRAFALVCDLRSLTAAAKVMQESKATVSRRISRLESVLGTELLRRSSRLVEMTADGVGYRARVGAILELLGDANATTVYGREAEPSGQLRVAAVPGLDAALAPVFLRFAEQYPQVVVAVSLASRLVDLEAEHFDVALRASTALADSSLVAVRVGDAPLERILVASPSYLAARPAPRRIHDLATHRFIGMGDTAAPTTLTLVRRASDETVSLRLPVFFASSSIAFTKELLLAGAGVAILPRPSVQRELDEQRLTHLFPGSIAPGPSLYLLHRGGRFLAPKIRVFVDFVREALHPGRQRSPRR
ncbi:LysR family transcriptional regulator [Nannocystis pusilla]|uniref:LysR family transcriptional regulator n=1 Tax=Nannocystis pusilla TaxID=889268 RepID=UPI003DA2803A